MTARTALSPSERRAYSRLRQLLGEPGVLRGTLVEMHRRCGKPTCRCARDAEARHRALILCVTLDGKRTSVYVPLDWETRVREWVERYGEMRDLVDQLSRSCLTRLRKRQEP
jgi:hypothetical protein